MIAFDTSLLVRIAVGDDAKQKAAALALLESDKVWIAKTVLLETEWVLRSRYAVAPDEIAEFFAYLVESEGIVVEDDPAVRRAIALFEAGADFADALHLASAGEMPLCTFDRNFCRAAVRGGDVENVRVVKA
jgi:predicted nucleic-acid-binding protein